LVLELPQRKDGQIEVRVPNHDGSAGYDQGEEEAEAPVTEVAEAA